MLCSVSAAFGPANRRKRIVKYKLCVRPIIRPELTLESHQTVSLEPLPLDLSPLPLAFSTVPLLHLLGDPRDILLRPSSVGDHVKPLSTLPVIAVLGNDHVIDDSAFFIQEH